MRPGQIPVSALILAGGRSTRMGRDKITIRLGGETLLERALRRIQSYCSEVLILAGQRDLKGFSAEGVRVVPDIYPGRGPLGGVHAGLKAASHPACFVVACDLPFFSPELLVGMWELIQGYQLVVPRLTDGRLEPMHAVYLKECLPAAEEQIRLGMGFSLLDLVPRVVTRYVDEPFIRTFGDPRMVFFNLNTPRDVDIAREKILGEKLEKGVDFSGSSFI